MGKKGREWEKVPPDTIAKNGKKVNQGNTSLMQQEEIVIPEWNLFGGAIAYISDANSINRQMHANNEDNDERYLDDINSKRRFDPEEGRKWEEEKREVKGRNSYSVFRCNNLNERQI